MFTVKEVYEKTGVPESRLYYEIKRGYVKAVEKYGKTLVKQSEVDKIIDRERRKRELTPIEEYCQKMGLHRSQVPDEAVEKINGLLFVKEKV